MKQKVISRLFAAALFLTAADTLSAQGTAIYYQGRLSDGGSPANASYNFRFAVFDAPTGGTNVSIWLTNSAVPVSNGLFSVTLDFGAGVFNGSANGSNDWLDVSVCTNGATNFTALTPRQPILPVPYAEFATSASNILGLVPASHVVGTIASSLVSGTYSNTVNFANGTNQFAGTFAGDGLNLTNLNASNLATGIVADARLSSNVPLLNRNQTFTGPNVFNGTVTINSQATFAGSNTFSGPVTFTGENTFTGSNNFNGVNTFTNNGNYFVGSFFGNGLVGWLPVYTPSASAMRDAGYLLLNWGLTTLTLPTSSSLFVGDIVRVSGAGGGGWLIKQNSGQSILGNFATYRNGAVNALPSPTSDGHGVAASADGTRMYAVGNDITGVYASSDSGNTWAQVSSYYLSGYWHYVACSANGKIVYAEPTGSSAIVVSTNGGFTWSLTSTYGNGTAISCSADGNTLITGNVACSGNGNYRARLVSGVITVSTNAGSAWFSIPKAPASGVTCLAVSSDCTRMVAGVSNGLLYATSDQGASWTTMTSSNQVWTGAWMSPDGAKFAATVAKTGSTYGGIYSCSIIPEPGTTNTVSTGSICGSQGSAVELQYIGNNQFMPVSSTGVIWAN